MLKGSRRVYGVMCDWRGKETAGVSGGQLGDGGVKDPLFQRQIVFNIHAQI